MRSALRHIQVDLDLEIARLWFDVYQINQMLPTEAFALWMQPGSTMGEVQPLAEVQRRQLREERYNMPMPHDPTPI